MRMDLYKAVECRYKCCRETIVGDGGSAGARGGVIWEEKADTESGNGGGVDSSVKHGNGGTGMEVEGVETEGVGKEDGDTQTDVVESSKPTSSSFKHVIVVILNEHVYRAHFLV